MSQTVYSENQKVKSMPAFDFNQNPIDLISKYKGTAILAIIYNNQCLGCTGRAIPLAYEFQKVYKTLQVIGIHSSFGKQKITEQDIKSIFTTDKLPFPIYLDPDKALYDQFQSEGTPQWVLISEEGVLLRSIFGSQENAQNRISYSLEELNLA